MAELPLVAQVDKWVSSQPKGEELARLAHLEQVLRTSGRASDRDFVLAIVAWRLRQQLNLPP